MAGLTSSIPFRVVWDDAAQVVRGDWLPGSVCSEDLARASTAAVEALGKGSVPVLFDIRNLKRIERGARAHYKVDKGGGSALALLVDSPVTKMIANFFMRTDVGPVPTQMFSDEELALTWLHSVPV